jgi:N-acetylglucosaminyl-diphospho-decaprenol L-rhamnosyltransferase
MQQSRVSVVVVSYNTIDKLRRCLSCIEAEHELIVVDNGSSDGSAAMVKAEFPRARLLENSANVGFGAANNQGMELARRELVLFLNSDAYAEPGAIVALAAVIDYETAAAGGRLLNLDGSTQDSVANELSLWAVFCEQFYLEKLFKGSSLFSPYWITQRVLGHGSAPVPQVMGACLLIKPIERFDERFFLYCEDTDLCKRLQKHGKILFVPDARFVHELGSSSVGASRWLSVARYNRGKELYFFIHHGRFASFVCWALNRKGAFFRLVAYFIASVFTVGRTWERVRLWWKVLTAPLQGPDRPPSLVDLGA